MDGLKQRCTTQLCEVSQMNAKTHQALQLQVCYLQVSSNLTPQLCYLSIILRLIHNSSYDAVNDALIYLRTKALGGVYLAGKLLSGNCVFLQKENGKLQEDLSKLTREKDLVELRLRSYEKESTQLVPTLEETQWEVSGIRSHISRHGCGHRLVARTKI